MEMMMRMMQQMQMGGGTGFGGMMGGGGGGMTNGFEGVGKLKGHESKLFRYQLVVFRTEYMEEGFQPCEEYDGKYVEGELINMLTPHHKLQLAADLAKGLLIKSTPLPPETILHHALFYDLMYRRLVTGIEVECDQQRIEEYDMEKRREEERKKKYFDSLSKEDQEDLKKKEEEKRRKEYKTYEGRASKTMLIGEALTRKEEREAKLSKKMAKKTGLKGADEDVLRKEMESEESDYNIESMANEFVERTESIAADFFTNNNRSNNQQRIIDLDDCEYHYTHRALLSNIIIERSLKRGMNFPGLPSLEDNECDNWIHLMRFPYGTTLIGLDEDESKLIHNNRRNKNQRAKLARNLLLENIVKKAEKVFESSWNVNEAVFCERLLLCLGNCGAAQGHQIPIVSGVKDPTEPTFAEILAFKRDENNILSVLSKITCDTCDCDCTEKSWHVEETSLDFCEKCIKDIQSKSVLQYYGVDADENGLPIKNLMLKKIHYEIKKLDRWLWLDNYFESMRVNGRNTDNIKHVYKTLLEVGKEHVNIDVQKYGYYDFKKQEWVEPHTLYNFNVYEHPKKWRKKWYVSIS